MPTLQHQQARAAFLIHAPAPAQRGAACIIDTGMDLNADTQPGVLARLTIDGSDQAGEGSPSRHGTRMAVVAGAAVNETGSVGIWPQLGLVSVRASELGASTFAFERYRSAISECLRARFTRGVPVRAINMSLGGPRNPDPEAAKRVGFAITEARDVYGINVVASAGNTPGPVAYPAALSGVYGVGANTAMGAACAFSAGGPGLDVAAPGCPVEFIDLGVAATRSLGQGTSPAAAITTAVLVALRSYRPDLTPDQAEQLLSNTQGPAGIDAEAAFRAAGLGTIVDEGNAALAARTPPSSDPARTPPISDPAGTAPAGDQASIVRRRLPTPRATIGYLRGALTVRARNYPAEQWLTIRVTARTRTAKTVRRSISTQRSRLTIRHWLAGKRLISVGVRYETSDIELATDSPTLTWRPKATRSR